MSQNMILEGIPEPTLRRLPAYCHVLRRMMEGHEAENVSCTQIGLELQLDPTQVRKDLAVTGAVGRPKVGYQVEELYERVSDFLGWNNAQDAVLVAAQVRVTVADGAIRRIEILHHENGRGKPAEAVLDRVIAAQSLRVDAVSGATSSSKVLLKAVENALRGPRKRL